MTTHTLIPYEKTKAPSVTIETELISREDAFFVSYKLTGDIKSIDLGGDPVHARKIKLWEKTCFELFIKNKNDQYMEFNFSPVFEWNAFFFNKKGDALKEFEKVSAVKIDILHSMEVFKVIVEIKKKDFPDDFFTLDMSAGLTTVLKERNGRLSYWALSHEDQRPNFHDFRSFRYKF